MLLTAHANALPRKKLAKSLALERDDEWKAFVMERIEKQDRKVQKLVTQNMEQDRKIKELVARLKVSHGARL